VTGETDLAILLRNMRPCLSPVEHGFAVVRAGEHMPTGLVAFAVIHEDEGMTLVASREQLVARGMAVHGRWARISLAVHSSLSAVGLTASMSAALAARGLSANVIAGFHHDHLFVPWERRDEAMEALAALSGPA